MCSIGWLRLKDSWFFFKNRDRTPGDPINKQNIFVQDKELAGLANKLLIGTTIGLNKYGLAIVTAAGPRNIAAAGKLTDAAVISEKVLRSCKNLRAAKEKYLNLAKDLGYNYNVIIADSKCAYALEITPNGAKEEKSDKCIARTNHFVKLKEYNKNKEDIARSEMRLKKLTELIKKAESRDDMLSALKFHADNDAESICRHNQWTETCASALFEIKGNKITAYYVLNSPPCKANFTEKPLEF